MDPRSLPANGIVQAGKAPASLDGSRAAVRALQAAEVSQDRSRLTTGSAVTIL